jgi:hypothetical protein
LARETMRRRNEFKAALSMNPPAEVRQEIESALAQLR